ncbi:MAG: tRNA pseudouridine(38-40) synthase TruA [Candidatus Marinimicrobia bacterium]|nr:tRNA pseudouridine(38-40) synthase TruA [Candidatus Neomarinimicrobiota bacterium]MCF7829700.1 tRNA pseudouridine(38-40) synthase TruA [Candidatus Neomarinimicrobiota bacterium]MCF7881650.1 tRNA pseudouridine(38-40) synthase TruA [Candidatus Neomarinimicrobiota bacterium]
MNRYALIIEYDGTEFHGWQIQSEVRTVQETIEHALAKLTQREIRIVGSGRTDTGVHARYQVAHFDNDKEDFTPETYTRGINSYLPEDVVIKHCVEVPDDFHARFDALRRDYIYTISTKQIAIERQYAWYIPSDFDRKILEEAAAIIFGKHDFRSFMSANSDTDNTVCEIVKSSWKIGSNRLRYLVYGNRFLHNMVRCLVGTMIEVARGRYTLPEFRDFVETPDKEAPVVRAPAQGLVLDKVHYRHNLQDENETLRIDGL